MAALGGRCRSATRACPRRHSTFRDPVSEVDGQVEVLIRARLADGFPEHDILGEEMDERPGRDHDFVWAVDPIDGTTNFVNGFPLFAASIGVLYRGRPVVGAVWCRPATSSAPASIMPARWRALLRPGPVKQAPTPTSAGGAACRHPPAGADAAALGRPRDRFRGYRMRFRRRGTVARRPLPAAQRLGCRGRNPAGGGCRRRGPLRRR